MILGIKKGTQIKGFSKHKKMLPSKALSILVSCWQKAQLDMHQMSSENVLCRKPFANDNLSIDITTMFFIFIVLLPMMLEKLFSPNIYIYRSIKTYL